MSGPAAGEGQRDFLGERPRDLAAGEDHCERAGYLGLGSNEGDRRAHLQAAVDAVAQHGVRVLAASSVYETEPVGEVPDQRPFYNAALRIATALSPEELLRTAKAVERELGRRPGGRRHGPRPIDVDLLLLGAGPHRSEALTLPHPEVAGRRFVLVPLLELEPELELPGLGPARLALARIRGQEVRRAGPPLRV